MPRSACLIVGQIALLLSITSCARCSRSVDAGMMRTPEDTIVVGWESGVDHLDPRLAGDIKSQHLEDLLHCSVMGVDPNGEVKPELAAAQPTWLDASTLSVILRDRILFSDGSPVTPQDVKATYDFFLASSSPRSKDFANLSSVQVKDERTVVFHLKTPDATFPGRLQIGILPAKVAQGAVKETSDSPTGCGGFLVESWQGGVGTLKANPRYNLAEAPRIARLQFKIFKDAEARFKQLRSGNLDLAHGAISSEDIAMVGTKYPALMLQKRPGLATTYIGFNMNDPVTGNPAVRKAVAMAIDRTRIIDHLLRGLAFPAQTLMTPDQFHFARSELWTYDPRGAEKLLDSVGLPRRKNGPRLTLSYKIPIDAQALSVAKALANQLDKVGVRLKIEPQDSAILEEELAHGRSQLWAATSPGSRDPDIYRELLEPVATTSSKSRRHYGNAEMEKLLTLGRITTDTERRREIYAKVQASLARDLPYFFLWHDASFVVHDKRLKDFTVYADGRLTALMTAHK